MNKISKLTWLNIVVFSLIGQIAWTMENMFYNLYIVDQFNANTSSIALMVTLSAITATVTTLFIGALSDKLKKRKPFIIAGYFIWGIVILAFIFISNKFIPESHYWLGILLVIVFDCLMTFFGSSANDACYNAYLTDISDNTNRGKIEGINSAMPLIAILIVFGGLSSFAKVQEDGTDTWYIVFLIVGIVVLLCGVLGIFTIKEPKIEKSEKEESYFKNIFYGFKPSVIKNNKTLYIALIGFAIFGISMQVFMPYYILYLQRAGITLPFDFLGFEPYIIVMAPAIIIAAIFTIFYGRIIDKLGFIKSLIPTVIMYVIGLMMLFLSKEVIFMFIGCTLMMMGYLCTTACFNTIIRNKTPKDKVGLFQGIRMFAQVLIPMLIGPWIGSSLCGGGAIMGVIDDSEFAVSPYIFLGAALIIILMIIPLLFLRKEKGDETK